MTQGVLKTHGICLMMYFKINWNAGPGTYCYNSCNTFSRSESGAEIRSQTFQFLIDILNQNQVVEQVSADI
jgi:hypothetical protein